MDHSKALSTAKLLLAISAPTLEECWAEGYEFSSLKSVDDNPFKCGSANHHHWKEGWWAGFFEKDNDCNDNISSYITDAASNDNCIDGTDSESDVVTAIAKNIYSF